MLLRRLLALTVLAPVLWAGVSLGADPKEEALKKEMKDLTGTWEVTKVKVAGMDEQALPPGTLQLVFTADGKYSEKIMGKENENGKYTVDPSKTPKTIDLDILEGMDKGKKQLGLYELKGDDLKIAFAEPGGKDRPADLAGKGAAAVVTLKRAK
jgi:uncharacterized protein (TIGR03067 family)